MFKKLLLSFAAVAAFGLTKYQATKKDILRTPAPTRPSSKGGYRDGNYTGVTADAFYGNVQVRIGVQNGKISHIEFLQYPSDRATSRRISAMAIPLLQSESIQAQSAQVDVVTGATATSQAFIESMRSALNQATL